MLLSGSNLPASALAEGCGKSQNCEYTTFIVMIASTILKIAKVLNVVEICQMLLFPVKDSLAM